MMLIHTKRYFSKSVTGAGTASRHQALVQELTQSVQFDSQNHIMNVPELPALDMSLDHAPKRTHTLNDAQKDLAIKNHLKYFVKGLHPKLGHIFREELHNFGHIYAFNYLPKVPLEALPYDLLPGQSMDAKAMQHMILNNLDPRVAQFPEELITYGSNGAVFSNWAQF